VKGLREGALFILGVVAVYMLLSLVTYDAADPGWSHSANSDFTHNKGGVAGAWFADIFLSLFGYFSYLFPVMVAYGGWLLYRGRVTEGAPDMRQFALRSGGFLLTLVAGSGLAALHFVSSPQALPMSTGAGGVGWGTGWWCRKFTGDPVQFYRCDAAAAGAIYERGDTLYRIVMDCFDGSHG